MTYDSTSIETQGFKFEIGNADSPLTYTEVKEVKNFQAFDGSAQEIDVTHLQSSGKEWKMGLQDFGGVQVDVNHLPSDTGQQAMRTAKGNRTIQDFKITFSDSTTATFRGYVLSNPLSGGVDAVVEGSFNIRVSGSVTFA